MVIPGAYGGLLSMQEGTGRVNQIYVDETPLKRQEFERPTELLRDRQRSNQPSLEQLL